jgi:hypothetical protein
LGDKFKKVKGAEMYVTGVERREMQTKFYWVNLNGSDHLGDLGVDGREILKCVLEK